MSDDDNVSKLPVRFKRPPGEDGEPMLRVVEPYGKDECNHMWTLRSNGGLSGRIVDVRYLIRNGETEVECGNCGKRLDPMFVLARLARDETQWNNTRKRYQEEMRRLSERSRTMCQHCGKMTRISRT